MKVWGGIAWLAGGLLLSACKDDGSIVDDGGDDLDLTTGASVTAGPGEDETTVAATSADSADTSVDDTSSAARPNWHEDIAPLVVEHCEGCHVSGGIAPYPLESYEDAGPLAPAIVQQVEARLMPPWHAIETDECQPPAAFKHDARLSDEQIQLLRDWADIGAPEGDPALAAPLPPSPTLDLPGPSATPQMQSPVTVEPSGSTLDFFHCLSLDPGNAQDVYLDGMQVIAGNSQIVHHVLIYVDVSATSATWPGGLYSSCGGGAGIPDALLVGAWVPGGLPMETPAGVGIRLPAGARIILNMHYHAKVTGPEVDDGTGLALRWQATAPEYVSEFTLIGAPAEGQLTTSPFMIPAGATGHQEVVDYTVPNIGLADVRVFSVLNHMHKVGVDMKTSVIRGGGQEECLVQTPAWDFNWQRLYEYDVPIEQSFQVQTGDVVRVRCTYDNTLDNPAVVEALNEVGLDEPQNVGLGEATLDEMCIVGVGVAVKLP
jgi:hypothetical protein